MSLEAVLVDRARVLRVAASATKVGGRTALVETEPGTWFDCRLFMPQSPESFDTERVSRRVVKAPTLLYSTDDDEGNPVELLPSDELEISSDDLGDGRWQVTAAAQPLRKREGVIGFQTTLKRIEVPAFAPKV